MAAGTTGAPSTTRGAGASAGGAAADDETPDGRAQGLLERGSARGTGERQEARCRARDAAEQIKLTRLTKVDDVEAYLMTFKQLMRLGQIDEMWMLRLAPQRTGKAQQAYAMLSAGDTTDYSKVKEAILRRYDISEETYRQRFRGERRKAEEAYVELSARLRDLAGKWMAVGHTVEEVLEKLVVEQLVNTMPAELRIWVAERKPKTGLEAG